MSKKGADRAIVTSEGIPVGVATVKDVFIKLGTKRLKGLSPSSMSVSGFMSDKFVLGKLDEDLLTRDSIYHADSAFKRLLVMDIMKRVDEHVEPDSHIEKVGILLKRGLNTLPVIADNKFVGLLTRDVIFLKFLELEESKEWKRL